MRKIKEIIVHHSLSDFGNAKTIGDWHEERGFDEIGYHYVITKDGQIQAGRDEEKVGAHAKGRNIYSIGVCLIGDFSKTKPLEVQYFNLILLCKHLIRKYEIKKVSPHRGKDNPCPGKKFNWSHFAQRLDLCV